jgi:hypothetical protein
MKTMKTYLVVATKIAKLFNMDRSQSLAIAPYLRLNPDVFSIG